MANVATATELELYPPPAAIAFMVVVVVIGIGVEDEYGLMPCSLLSCRTKALDALLFLVPGMSTGSAGSGKLAHGDLQKLRVRAVEDFIKAAVLIWSLQPDRHGNCPEGPSAKYAFSDKFSDPVTNRRD